MSFRNPHHTLGVVHSEVLKYKKSFILIPRVNQTSGPKNKILVPHPHFISPMGRRNINFVISEQNKKRQQYLLDNSWQIWKHKVYRERYQKSGVGNINKLDM